MPEPPFANRTINKKPPRQADLQLPLDSSLQNPAPFKHSLGRTHTTCYRLKPYPVQAECANSAFKQPLCSHFPSQPPPSPAKKHSKRSPMRNIREGDPERPLALRIQNITHTQWPEHKAVTMAFHSGYCHLRIAPRVPTTQHWPHCVLSLSTSPSLSYLKYKPSKFLFECQPCLRSQS